MNTLSDFKINAEHELDKVKVFIAETKEYSKKKSVADKVVHGY